MNECIAGVHTFAFCRQARPATLLSFNKHHVSQKSCMLRLPAELRTSLAIAVQDTMARQGLTNVKCFVTNLRAGSIQATVGLYMSNVVELEQVKWFGGNHLTKVRDWAMWKLGLRPTSKSVIQGNSRASSSPCVCTERVLFHHRDPSEAV